MTSTTQSAYQNRLGHQARGSPKASLLGRFLQILRRLPHALAVSRERRALMSLSDHSLKDLGLSRADAYREANRPWWEFPDDR